MLEFSIQEWLDKFQNEDYILFIKRLSGNDTLANKSHQAGPYIPKQLAFTISDLGSRSGEVNPRYQLELYIDSHITQLSKPDAKLIWYNNKSRNECRITGLGGASSPLLAEDSTASIAVFAFKKISLTLTLCHVWIAETPDDEYIVEERFGPIEPGEHQTINFAGLALGAGISSNCNVSITDVPASWLTTFPSPAEIFNFSVRFKNFSKFDVDKRLVKRRVCEHEIYNSVENIIEFPKIARGFPDIEGFMRLAQTILQRRKARGGSSLERHIRHILDEERFMHGINYSHQGRTERSNKPDFIFPNESSYSNLLYPSDKLRILAVKSTVKDRWRQVLREADRVEFKHLFTLQEGISVNQFNEMYDHGIRLVVPSPLFIKYNKSIRHNLISFEEFIGDVRTL